MVLWIAVSDFMVPEYTRKTEIRPAWGSMMVLKTKADTGPSGVASRATSSSAPGRVPMAAGRSAGDGSRSTITSRSGCTPTLRAAETGITGKIFPVATASRRPLARSSAGSVPFSKNSSIRASLLSATISTSFSRAALAASCCASGMSAVSNFPLASSPQTKAFSETRSTTPRKSFSCPTGMAMGIAVRPKDVSMDSRARSKDAFSRSIRFTTMTRARP